MFRRISLLITYLIIGLLLARSNNLLAKSAAPAAQTDFSLHINIGSTEPHTTVDNVTFLADQEWSAEVDYGYLGGVALSKPDFWLINGTDDEPLYRTLRRGWQEYRVRNVPAGTYLVTLHFAELFAHGPDLTVFDVSIEGQPRLVNFDAFAEVGLDYALERNFYVTVADGELTLRGQPISRDTHLSGISIVPAVADTVAPAIPTELQVIPSYETALLTWEAPSDVDVNGYFVYRSDSPTGQFQQLTTEPIHVTRYIDQFDAITDPAKPSDTVWYYQINSVDLYANQSSVTPPVGVQPLSLDSIDIPVYELDIVPADLAALQADIWLDPGVSATLTFENQTYPTKVRFRGNFSREYPKKSWKIIFPDDSPYAERDRLNLKSHYDDYTLMRGALTAAMYRKVGIRPPTTDHAALFVNGEYMGVFSDYEQVNSFYMGRTGRNPDSTVYEPRWTPYANYGDLLPNLAAYRDGYEIKNNGHFGYRDLISFIETLNNTPDQFFPSRLNQVFEIRNYLDYYAAVIFTNNVEFTRHDLRILQDRESGRWEFIPWDPDYTWGYIYPFATYYNSSQPISTGTLSTPGTVFHGPNRFLSRVMDVPEYRAYFCQRLTEITTNEYANSEVFPLIDDYYGLIEEEVVADWWKAEGTNRALFQDAPNQLKQFVQTRIEYLRSEIPAYCGDPQSVLRINELVTENGSSYCDVDDATTQGCYDDWLEIYNSGLAPVDLQGLYLTDEPSNPTKFQFTESIVVPSKKSVVVWADTETQQGPTHTNFKLDVFDPSLSLYAQDGSTLIDRMDVPFLATAQSFGRYPDGANEVYRFEATTPNEPNRIGLIFEQVTAVPQVPSPTEVVTVTARFFDDSSLQEAQLFYNSPITGWSITPFEQKDDARYEAVIPAQPDGAFVKYYIRAISSENKIITQPEFAPIDVFDYIVGYRRPTVVINELVAAHDLVSASGANDNLQRSSWFELFNPGNSPIQVEGMYLSEDPNVPRKYRIPDRLLIPARGYMVFFANATSGVSPWHTNFQLDKQGGMLTLYDTDANQNQIIDTYTYEPQKLGHSEYRCFNHFDLWNRTGDPTPGFENEPMCEVLFLPYISQE